MKVPMLHYNVVPQGLNGWQEQANIFTGFTIIKKRALKLSEYLDSEI